MATLVMALQTVGEAWESLSTPTQQALTNWIAKQGYSEKESEVLQSAVKAGLRSSPLTGSICSLALYDVTRQETIVYIVTDKAPTDIHVGDVVCKLRSEAALLKELWHGATHYDRFVTFDGRRFVVPFLLHRSAINEVLPTVSLLEQRFLERQQNVTHVDLLDQLTFYGAMRKRPNLLLWCQAFSIDYGGYDPAQLDAYATSASYEALAAIARDEVTAVARLYDCWQSTYLHEEPGSIDF